MGKKAVNKKASAITEAFSIVAMKAILLAAQHAQHGVANLGGCIHHPSIHTMRGWLGFAVNPVGPVSALLLFQEASPSADGNCTVHTLSN